MHELNRRKFMQQSAGAAVAVAALGGTDVLAPASVLSWA